MRTERKDGTYMTLYGRMWAAAVLTNLQDCAQMVRGTSEVPLIKQRSTRRKTKECFSDVKQIDIHQYAHE